MSYIIWLLSTFCGQKNQLNTIFCLHLNSVFDLFCVFNSIISTCLFLCFSFWKTMESLKSAEGCPAFTATRSREAESEQLGNPAALHTNRKVRTWTIGLAGSIPCSGFSGICRWIPSTLVSFQSDQKTCCNSLNSSCMDRSQPVTWYLSWLSCREKRCRAWCQSNTST